MRNKKGQFSQELDHAVMIKFFTDYQDKIDARDKALKEGKKLGTKMRELVIKWLSKE